MSEAQEPSAGNDAPCSYESRWTDEVGMIPVCIAHGNNSRHVDSDDPHRPCLSMDPYPDDPRFTAPAAGQGASLPEHQPVNAENVAGLDQAAEPCWSPATADGQAFEWGEGTPHWQSEEEGRERLAAILKEYDDAPGERPNLSLSRESEPCWHLTCDECGYRYDEDEWVSHFPDRAEAKRAAEDCDWHIEAGRLLCAECVLPPAADQGASDA